MCVLQSHGAAIVFLASRLFGHRSRNREHHDERRPPERRVPIEAELPDRARARVAVSHVGRPIELLPEARADRVDGRNLGHGQHNVAAIRDDADHPAYARLQRTQHTAIIGGADFELVRGLHAGDVVPLECDGPRVVGLQFEAGKLHARDFAGHAVAVAEPDDIGLGLGPRRGAWPPDERRENDLDRAALEGGAQHHRPDQGGVGLGQVLELGRVVLVDAVGLATGRQRRDPRSHRRPRLDAAVSAVLPREVLYQSRGPESRARQQGPLPVAV